MKTIFVSNLPNDTNQAEVKELFSPFGSPRSITLNLGGGAREHHGTALVELNDGDGDKAIAGLDGRLFKGAILSLGEASDVQLAAVTASGSTPQPSLAESDERPSNLQRHHYEVASVERASPPTGGRARIGIAMCSPAGARASRGCTAAPPRRFGNTRQAAPLPSTSGAPRVRPRAGLSSARRNSSPQPTSADIRHSILL